jgi:hypothetical protein
LVKVVQRESLGLTTCAELAKGNKLGGSMLAEMMVALLHAFLLGVGDMQLGNTLVAANSAWLIDYEDDSHRALDAVKQDDFLFKTPQGAVVKDLVTKYIAENKATLNVELDRAIEKTDAILQLAHVYGVTVDLAKRIEVARNMLL